MKRAFWFALRLDLGRRCRGLIRRGDGRFSLSIGLRIFTSALYSMPMVAMVPLIVLWFASRFR
jgi:hypothetical protein